MTSTYITSIAQHTVFPELGFTRSRALEPKNEFPKNRSLKCNRFSRPTGWRFSIRQSIPPESKASPFLQPPWMTRAFYTFTSSSPRLMRITTMAVKPLPRIEVFQFTSLTFPIVLENPYVLYFTRLIFLSLPRFFKFLSTIYHTSL